LAFTGTNTQNGPVTVGTGATVQFNGVSTWTGSAGSSGLGTVQLQGGTINFNGANALASAVNLTGATVDATGAMPITALFTWSGAYLGAPSSPGAGTTTLAGGANINGNVFLNRNVTNASGSVVTESANVTLYSNSAAPTWTNQGGSTFTFSADGGMLV